MTHRIAPLPFKPSRLDGLSERLLASHYENNYGGAVRRLNAIEAELAVLDWPAAPGFRINGLKREALIAANSMLLHEAYFEALGGAGEPIGALAAALERDFGSVGRWRAEFTGLAKAMAGGSGWALLVQSPRLGRLVNQWAADHAHVLAEGRVVLALDMYEHAYALDFGARAAAYVDAFMRNVAWDRAEARLLGAPAAPTTGDDLAPEDLRRLIDAGDVVACDARNPEDRAASGEQIPGSVRPEAAPKDRPVAVYCVYGFQVGREAAAALRRRGCEARVLAGGISAWKASGGPTESLRGQ